MSTFLLDGYDPQGFYCELLRSADNALLHDRLAAMPTADFKRRVVGAEQALYNLGITFTVYSANPNFRPVMRGVAVRHKAYVNRAARGRKPAGGDAGLSPGQPLLRDRSALGCRVVALWHGAAR